MSKLGSSLIKGAEEALAYAKGNKSAAKAHRVYIPAEIDVREVRESLHLTRQEFCARFGFSIRTLEKWEQGARKPEGPARGYLAVIKAHPKMVEKTLLASKNL